MVLDAHLAQKAMKYTALKNSVCMQAHPGIIAASMPWLNGLDYKRLCSWMPYISVVLVLTRDKGSGRVTLGPDGLPRVHYWPDKHDRQSMMNVSSCPLPADLSCHSRCKT